MCRRKRSRPSSNRRLTKNVKRLSSGRSVCASAIGVDEEQRFRTYGTAPAVGGAALTAPASERAEAKVCIAVIDFPGLKLSRPHRWSGTALSRNGRECYRSRPEHDRGSPAVLGIVL